MVDEETLKELEALRKSNEQLADEVRELHKQFKEAFNSEPVNGGTDDEFAKECAKLFKRGEKA